MYKSTKFALPFQPLVSGFGVLFTVHLIVTLGTTAYIRFLVWQALAVAVYFIYGVHHTKEDAERTQPLLLETDPATASESRL